jgi:hypothetical protein
VGDSVTDGGATEASDACKSGGSYLWSANRLLTSLGHDVCETRDMSCTD